MSAACHCARLLDVRVSAFYEMERGHRLAPWRYKPSFEKKKRLLCEILTIQELLSLQLLFLAPITNRQTNGSHKHTCTGYTCNAGAEGDESGKLRMPLVFIFVRENVTNGGYCCYGCSPTVRFATWPPVIAFFDLSVILLYAQCNFSFWNSWLHSYNHPVRYRFEISLSLLLYAYANLIIALLFGFFQSAS